MELEERKRLADTVLEALAQLPRETSMILAATLMMSRGELAGIGDAFDGYLRGSPELARLQVAFQLRRLSLDPGLLEHLVSFEEEPWLSLRRALEQLRDAELDAMRAP
jgi:hypothetical protein